MPTVSRTFTVTPTPAQILPYLADFANAEEWDPGTESCSRIGTGPVEPGAQWHNVSKILGVTAELTYTLREVTDDRVVLVGENDSTTTTDTILVKPAGEGSEITYTVEFEMSGVAKLATPAMKVVFEKLGTDTEEQLTEVLNRW